MRSNEEHERRSRYSRHNAKLEVLKRYHADSTKLQYIGARDPDGITATHPVADRLAGKVARLTEFSSESCGQDDRCRLPRCADLSGLAQKSPPLPGRWLIVRNSRSRICRRLAVAPLMWPTRPKTRLMLKGLSCKACCGVCSGVTLATQATKYECMESRLCLLLKRFKCVDFMLSLEIFHLK